MTLNLFSSMTLILISSRQHNYQLQFLMSAVELKAHVAPGLKQGGNRSGRGLNTGTAWWIMANVITGQGG